MARPKYINLYLDYLEAIEPFSDAERGRLFTALLEYGRTGAMPELSGNERFIFPTIRAQIDRDFEVYENKCRKNSENRQQGTITKTTAVNDRQRPSAMVNEINQEEEEGEEEDKDKGYIPPLTPRGRDGKSKTVIGKPAETKAELLKVWEQHSLTPALKSAVKEWVKYKSEKNQSYKPQGLHSLLLQINKKAEEYGEASVIDLIAKSMANGYKGIIWDKLQHVSGAASPLPDKKSRFCNYKGRKWDYGRLQELDLEYMENDALEYAENDLKKS